MRSLSFLVALVLAAPSFAGAATVYIDPDSGTFGPGDTFIASVRLGNEDDCINTVHVEVDYPKDSLRATDFGKGDSIFTLWVEEPKLDVANGRVSFSGGIPGGYCGRIQGDPGLTNLLGKIIFTVIDPSAKKALIHVSPLSEVYLNDGLGTKAPLEGHDATLSLAQTRQSSTDAWLEEVQNDTVAPEPFDVQVESSRSVFGGHYFAVFSTTDKQSGIDHFEVLSRGGWQTIMSPFEIGNSSMLQNLQIRAVDKAGNVREGSYDPNQVPPRQYSVGDFTALFFIAGILLLALLAKLLLDRRQKAALPPSASEPPSA